MSALTQTVSSAVLADGLLPSRLDTYQLWEYRLLSPFSRYPKSRNHLWLRKPALDFYTDEFLRRRVLRQTFIAFSKHGCQIATQTFHSHGCCCAEDVLISTRHISQRWRRDECYGTRLRNWRLDCGLYYNSDLLVGMSLEGILLLISASPYHLDWNSSIRADFRHICTLPSTMIYLFGHNVAHCG